MAIDATLRLSLREGSIYYFTERTLTSTEPHFFFVVNAEPLKDKVLVLSVSTSKVAEVKFRSRDCPECLVELGPAELPGILTRPSIVDCNSLKLVPLVDFNARYVRKEITCFGQDLPKKWRHAFRAAIHASKVVTQETKALVAAP